MKLKKFVFTALLPLIPALLNAQCFSVGGLLDYAQKPPSVQRSILNKNGFAEVYNGPKKLGGFLALFRQKKTHEYLFIHSTESGAIASFNYYLPTRVAYANAIKPIGVKKDVDYFLEGLVEYEGKKYYHLVVPVINERQQNR